MTKLKEMRLRRNLRQVDLANRLHVNKACVSIAERTGIRTVCSAERYAAALNCHPAELIDFKIPVKTNK